MSTAAQAAANRRNAEKSTGPRTDTGKARVAQNALRHGLCSEVPLMNDEDLALITGLLDALREEHQPATPTEELLVYKMAEHFWNAKRAAYHLTEQFEFYDQDGENAGQRQISLMIRYHAAADRGFYKALTELRKLQKERKLEEIGFVPQEAETVAAEPAPPAPISRPEPQIHPVRPASTHAAPPQPSPGAQKAA